MEEEERPPEEMKSKSSCKKDGSDISYGKRGGKGRRYRTFGGGNSC